MVNQRRVVVTGMGLITALGIDLGKSWEGLISGRSGVAPVEHFDVSKIACRIAAQVKNFQPEKYKDFKAARRMDRFAHFAVKSSKDAIEDSGLVIDDSNSDMVGVMVGSGVDMRFQVILIVEPVWLVADEPCGSRIGGDGCSKSRAAWSIRVAVGTSLFYGNKGSIVGAIGLRWCGGSRIIQIPTDAQGRQVVVLNWMAGIDPELAQRSI